jgi:hypothetical protein
MTSTVGSTAVGSTALVLVASGNLVGGGSVVISVWGEQAEMIRIDNVSKIISAIVVDVSLVVMISSYKSFPD